MRDSAARTFFLFFMLFLRPESFGLAFCTQPKFQSIVSTLCVALTSTFCTHLVKVELFFHL